MPLPVQLKDVVGEMEIGGNEWTAYVNRKTGELTSFPNDLLRYEGEAGTAVGEWDEEMAADYKRVLDSQDFIGLPGEYEIQEYAIMERFCLSVDSQQHRGRLLDAIRGKGAFRRFKDLALRLGVIEDWYRYREEALKRIAAEFLHAEGIPFVDDSPGRAP
ncbi:MAG: hypothetical protein E6G95_14445 [Alphaproteobacteria bacterium]|jgi:hypothetical protein|nr:MAG: hypothetical protein E6G95_14445 [Alphaproteobacteria bacterium]